MKMRGYRATHRNRWLLLENKILTKSEFLIFEYLIDIAVFDRNKDDYGIATIKVAFLVKTFQYTSANSIYKKLEKLVKVGLIVQAQSGWTKLKVVNHPRYLLQNIPQYGLAHKFSKDETSQPVEQVLQSIGIKSQFIEQQSQHIEQNSCSYQTDNQSKALGSFKVNSSSFSDTSNSNLDYSFESTIPISEQRLMNEAVEEASLVREYGNSC